MLRWLYIRILWSHPAPFRQRFGDEMLESFDRAADFSDHLRLLLDGVASLLRQWVLRPDFRQPWQPASAAGPAYEPITFQQIEPYKPNGLAMAEGGLLALLVLAGVITAINHGGGKVRTFLIGMHRPGFGLIRVERVEGGKLNTTVEAGSDVDPWRPFARSYFRAVKVLGALDADANLTISAEEILAAPSALLTLDANHDGKLSAEECGFLPAPDLVGAKALQAARLVFMRENPVLAALDLDGDGEISASEIVDSPTSLRTLDIIADGKLTPYEVIPSRALARAAELMSRFDTNDAGVLSIQGLNPEDADTPAIRRMLIDADRNHDGVVTRGELIVALAGQAHVAVPPTLNTPNHRFNGAGKK